LTILAEIKLRLNSLLDRRAVLSDPMAFDPIYINIFIFLYILFIKLSHISQNMQLEPLQYYFIWLEWYFNWRVYLGCLASGTSFDVLLGKFCDAWLPVFSGN